LLICLFIYNKKVMISATFKIEISDDIDINEIKLPLTGPNISL